MRHVENSQLTNPTQLLCRTDDVFSCKVQNEKLPTKMSNERQVSPNLFSLLVTKKTSWVVLESFLSPIHFRQSTIFSFQTFNNLFQHGVLRFGLRCCFRCHGCCSLDNYFINQEKLLHQGLLVVWSLPEQRCCEKRHRFPLIASKLSIMRIRRRFNTQGRKQQLVGVSTFMRNIYVQIFSTSSVLYVRMEQIVRHHHPTPRTTCFQLFYMCFFTTYLYKYN